MVKTDLAWQERYIDSLGRDINKSQTTFGTGASKAGWGWGEQMDELLLAASSATFPQRVGKGGSGKRQGWKPGCAWVGEGLERGRTGHSGGARL